MLLSDRDIRSAVSAGRIVIDPEPDLTTQLGPCALDLRLGSTFVQSGTRRTVPLGEQLTLAPGGFVLGATLEIVTLAADLAAWLEGRSTLARQGIIVHGTAGLIAPGSSGVIVLEFANLGDRPVALTPGQRVCSLMFQPLSSPAERPYQGRYQGQRGP